MKQTAIQTAEIYTSETGAVYQCDRSNRLILSFAGHATVLKVEAFLRLKRVVDSIDLQAMANSPARCSDYEIVSVCGCDRCFVLTLTELIALKELLASARFMMELNSMLHQCLNAELV
ncbi:hypothetical protein [Pontibacter akesuensis]|uniref:Uncharacterized protein n=1 Tax=Pontibacter akesuensis TaxID=388950 RepID=A0A1I7JYM6_9BACT|nr:hypothetical protein [Pontibacter akesuensis]GHA76476.1 hypothetical protein GCM10007389_33040 [Pontibacter akesuensis]SFU90323.1 hypothetical protein SAMN04487941_3198 [Pontibacter akesuensis]